MSELSLSIAGIFSMCSSNPGCERNAGTERVPGRAMIQEITADSVRAHALVAGLIPSTGRAGGSRSMILSIDVFLALSLSLLLS